MKCDTCKHQNWVDDEFVNACILVCSKGHWESIGDRDQFDSESIEPWEDPWMDCEDYEPLKPESNE